jgi:anti-sigma factor RsiW
MKPCPDREAMLHAYVDDELDAANVLAAEAHLKTCEGCAGYVRTLQALRTRLDEAEFTPPASAALRQRIEAGIRAEGQGRPRLAVPRRWSAGLASAWAAGGAMAGVMASLLLVQLSTPALEAQLVAGHVRSLQADHLVDVATSDRHTVKPWFNGRLDFAPPVVDLADQGFPLVGGRLDYADHRQVAALVYRRRAHVINLFVMPAGGRAAWTLPTAHNGYAVVHWTHAGLDYWAVSDIEHPDLEAFHKAFAARTPS